MKTHHPENERIKRKYLIWLKDAKGRNEASLDVVAKALSRFEAYTKYRDFKLFRIEQARAFKDHLAVQLNVRTGEPVSVATLHSTLGALKAFFQWLSERSGYKRRIQHADAEYFSLSEKLIRAATARRPQRHPTFEQVMNVINSMPAGSDVEVRDRALIAFILLTGARDGATASFKLKHINVAEGTLLHDAREVRTKSSKSMTSLFYPLGDELRQIVVDWVEHLRRNKLWGADDPLFPATETTLGADHRFEVTGLARRHWSTASPIRKVFKIAFDRAGLPYANPHSLRRTIVQIAYDRKLNLEQFRVWSENLGHDSALTTLLSYGGVSPERRAEIMREQHTPNQLPSRVSPLAAEIIELLDRRGV